MSLESKKRLDSIIAEAKLRTGRDAADLTEAVQALCDAVDGHIDGTITEINNEVVTVIGEYAFRNCKKLTHISFPNATAVKTYAFYNCTALECADFSNVDNIAGYGFGLASALKVLIIRCKKVCTLAANTPFNSTPIKSGTGYIYVPRALVNSYKTATNWVTYAAQFRALEDYTIDGTTTGALDMSKI